MSCSLCGLALPNYPIVDQESSFCCHGCHAVFQILSVKEALDDYQNHPVFKQAIQAGLISNPHLLDEIRERQSEAVGNVTKKISLEIGDMWCPSCAELIRLILLKEKGITKCVVDYSTDLAVIEFSPYSNSEADIKKRIETLGYLPLDLDAPERRTVSYQLYFRFIVAAFCSLNVMMFAYPIYATYFDYDEQGVGLLFSWLSLAASIPVATYCAWPIYRRAWSALFVGIVGMEALVTIGVLSAFAFSLYDLLNGGTQVYFDSMTVVVVFVLLGRIIESKAKFSAKSSLIRLHKGIPKKGRKKMEGEFWQIVSIKEIFPGDRIQVVTGEKIVLDGIVKKGSGTCDESLMTGESMPIVKEEGARVLAGSILQQGCIEVEVLGAQEDTTLRRILDMVEAGVEHKSAYIRAVDPWMKAFVPFILIFATAVFAAWLPYGFEPAFLRMLAVLLISCPCAIGVAAPLAESHFMQAMLSLGAIVRNRGILRFLGNETVFVFDKTGTITLGVFQVLSGLDDLTTKQKMILKSITARSMHPVSRAVSQAIKEPLLELSDTEEVAGKGIKAVHAGERYYVGSRSFLVQNGIAVHDAEPLATTVFFARDTTILSVLVLGDQLRKEAAETVALLAPRRRLLLSGDSKNAVEVVAEACGFSECFFEATPLQKREVVEDLKKEGEIVCMLGDGINDAPALTSAHIGISVLSAADISIQVSDLLLTTDRLDVLPTISRLAKKTHRIIKQNLFWAFFYNAIGIFLAAAGLLSPIFAAAAMVLSSLIVLFNAQRLSRSSPRQETARSDL